MERQFGSKRRAKVANGENPGCNASVVYQGLHPAHLTGSGSREDLVRATDLVATQR
jgi:hypothetical protein